MGEAFAYKLLSAMSQGAAFALFPLGVAVAFRWVRFPDLTGDGSFTLGGAVAATVLVRHGVLEAVAGATVTGFLAGLATFCIYRYLGVPKVLSGVLLMMGLYTLNLRLLGQPNVPIPRSRSLLQFVESNTGAGAAAFAFVLFGGLMAVFAIVAWLLLSSRFGMLMRATGTSTVVSRNFGLGEWRVGIGLGISNALVAISGALVAQRSFSADIHMGIGQIIVALAAVFIGSVLIGTRRAHQLVLAALVGSILYMLLMQIALGIGVSAADFKAISMFVVLASVLLFRLREPVIPTRRGGDPLGLE